MIDALKFLWLAKILNAGLNWLHQPFKKIIPRETFNYLWCGSTNTFLDSFLYFVVYNFVIQKKSLDLGLILVSPHIMAFIIVFPITFLTGFWFSKYLTFSQSTLKGRIQLFRFGITIIGSLIMQYLLLKFFVEVCAIYPTPSKLITSAIVAIITYITHRLFTFRTVKQVYD